MDIERVCPICQKKAKLEIVLWHHASGIIVMMQWFSIQKGAVDLWSKVGRLLTEMNFQKMYVCNEHLIDRKEKENGEESSDPSKE